MDVSGGRARARSAGRRGHARGARGGAIPRRPCRNQHHPAGDAVDVAARRGHRARELQPVQVAAYFAAATQAASCSRPCGLRIGAARRPSMPGGDRSTSRSASFPASRPNPPSQDFIVRNSGDAQQIEVGWWPGDYRYPRAAFYAYAYPSPEGFAEGTLSPANSRWDEALGEFILDWDDIRACPDPYEVALSFARSAVAHGCRVCGWNSTLAASMTGDPPTDYLTAARLGRAATARLATARGAAKPHTYGPAAGVDLGRGIT